MYPVIPPPCCGGKTDAFAVYHWGSKKLTAAAIAAVRRPAARMNLRHWMIVFRMRSIFFS
jgi:hypothetical protein